MRLRIIDINCRWFWFTLFFYVDHSPKRGYHIESNLYEYQKWSGPWFNFWRWEPMPDRRPRVAKTEPVLTDSLANPLESA